ncbi:Uncharacterised protein [Rothia dentocariosa]|uniref:Uncharacterized protein n=1 Tax=Rothia dentocariosa TaxID=2047 RepID=A0A3S5AHZ2_9MICC|nr:Uncharacterised protein [Rothia dentocariosa]
MANKAGFFTLYINKGSFYAPRRAYRFRAGLDAPVILACERIQGYR